MKHHVIGIDFGTLSARALLLDTATGEEKASAVMDYPRGVMEHAMPDGRALERGSALQDPADFSDVLAPLIGRVLADASLTAGDVAGLGIDFTTCTMLPLDRNLRPLCHDPRFAAEPHAYVRLWKHRTAQPQADAITALARERGEGWLSYYGGRISAEWMLPKILQTLDQAPEVFAATYRFFEGGDYLSLLLTGKESHSRSFTDLKANHAPDIGFPSSDFLSALHPALADLYGTRLSDRVDAVGRCAGRLNERGAALTSLPVGTPLAMPVLDAGAAMPACGITGEGDLLMILGTSGVLQINHRRCLPVSGICGCMKEGLLPDYYTYEAGLSAVGDVFDWFVSSCLPASYTDEAKRRGISPHAYLTELSQDEPVGASGLLCLDWLCGNRSVLNDADLSGMILGLTLKTRPEQIYRALIEATAFGMKRACAAYEEAGIPIRRILAAGGIAHKNGMLMQIYADVLGREILLPESRQASARGCCIYAAHAAGLYPTLHAAISALASPIRAVYRPIPDRAEAYGRLYREYLRLHDYFGRGENPIMKTLSALRKQ